ncbi:hypothetical protein, partial [Aquiflexum sp.]|uniref:hypothetical protein n=1 Tax=Aquiflexum sp. TaxID=1872584 RepID=UPI003592ECF1
MKIYYSNIPLSLILSVTLFGMAYGKSISSFSQNNSNPGQAIAELQFDNKYTFRDVGTQNLNIKANVLGSSSGEFVGNKPRGIKLADSNLSEGAIIEPMTIQDNASSFDPYSFVQAEDFSTQTGIQLSNSGAA